MSIYPYFFGRVDIRARPDREKDDDGEEESEVRLFWKRGGHGNGRGTGETLLWQKKEKNNSLGLI